MPDTKSDSAFLRWHYPDQVHKGMISAFRHPYADDNYSILTTFEIKQKETDASSAIVKMRQKTACISFFFPINYLLKNNIRALY
jgi:hypothetical protein